MDPRQRDLNDLYTGRTHHVTQRVVADPSQAVWQFLNQPSVIITAVLIAATYLCNAYLPQGSFEEVVFSAGQRLWAALVTITPAPLLFAVDNWLDPQMVGTQTKTHVSKSAAMRRIFGLDKGRGIVASVFQARSRALSLTGGALGLKADTNKPAGLGNRDNSCFQNSILQGLASLDTLPDYLATCLRNVEKDGDDADSAVTQTLRSLLSDLNDASNNGRTLWTPSKLRMLSTWTQQDAQEYFSKILDDIDKAASKALEASRRHSGFESDGIGKDDAAASQHSDDSGYSSSGSNKASDTASFRNPLEGLLAQRVSCVQCGHSDGLSMIPFNCLTLSLGLRRQHDLYERLDSYSTLESIEGVECPKCTLLKAQRLLNKLVTQMREKGTPETQLTEPARRLEAVELALEEDHFDEKTLAEECKISNQSKVTTTKTKQIVIARPPQSLAVHVNRSVFDPSTFDMIKNSAPVDFPMTLDLGPWCLGSAGGTHGIGDLEKEESGPLGDGEHWLQDPTSSMVAGDLKPSKLSGPVYELRAVVTHYGRHENGHYICYRRHPRSTPPSSRRSSAEPEKDGTGDVDDVVPDDHIPLEDIGDEKEDSGEREMDWWRLSDHNVSKVDAETVSSLAPGVFMLFYDCIDPSMVLSESAEEEVSESLATQVGSQPEPGPELTKQPEAGAEMESVPRPSSNEDIKP